MQQLDEGFSVACHVAPPVLARKTKGKTKVTVAKSGTYLPNQHLG